MTQLIQLMMGNKITVGIGAVAAGVLAGLTGLILIALKIQIAAGFFGARITFGMPWDSSDQMKIVLVVLIGLAAIGASFLMFAAGIGFVLFEIYSGKSGAQKNVAAGGE